MVSLSSCGQVTTQVHAMWPRRRWLAVQGCFACEALSGLSSLFRDDPVRLRPASAVQGPYAWQDQKFGFQLRNPY